MKEKYSHTLEVFCNDEINMYLSSVEVRKYERNTMQEIQKKFHYKDYLYSWNILQGVSNNYLEHLNLYFYKNKTFSNLIFMEKENSRVKLSKLSLAQLKR